MAADHRVAPREGHRRAEGRINGRRRLRPRRGRNRRPPTIRGTTCRRHNHQRDQDSRRHALHLVRVVRARRSELRLSRLGSKRSTEATPRARTSAECRHPLISDVSFLTPQSSFTENFLVRNRRLARRTTPRWHRDLDCADRAHLPAPTGQHAARANAHGPMTGTAE